MKIGLLGLGIMGQADARRFISQNHSVYAFNRSIPKDTSLRQSGSYSYSDDPNVVF